MARSKKAKERTSDVRQEDTESNRTGRIGHRQIANLLDRYQMIPADLSVDKGEDVIVQIGERDRFTGASFYGQFKSSSEITKRNSIVTCSVKTNHIDRWNAHRIPVFLFVTGINEDIAYWLEINDELVRDLDQKAPNWRDQETITVYLPEVNKVDDDGTQRIREIVMQRFAPMLAAKEFHGELKAVFPTTEEGKKATREMQRLLDSGDTIAIPSKFIDIKTPDWWNRWHGGPITLPPESTVTFKRHLSKDDKTFRLRMMTSSGRVAAVQNVVMRAVKQGAIEVTYSNQHNPTPFYCELVFRKEGKTLTQTFTCGGHGSKTGIQELKDALPFLQAYYRGGKLQISEKSLKSATKGMGPALDVPENNTWPLDDDFELLLEKCLFIERTIGAKLYVADLKITEQDIRNINYFTTVLQAGYIAGEEDRLSVVLTPRPSDTGENVVTLAEGLLQADEDGEPFPISTDVGEVTGFLMGTELSLGPAKNHILSKLSAESKIQLQAYIQDPATVDKMEVVLEDVKMTAEYSDWLPEPFQSPNDHSI